MTTERPNECVICLRPATGYHYGIVSCKGCKTFFRRTCVSKEEAECNLRKKCFDSTEKTPINLRCIACRFRKCIEKGMKISALELKKDEKLVVNSKRLGKPEVCSTSKRLDIVRIESKETLSNNIIQSLVYLESKLEMFRLSAFNPDYLELGSLTDIMNSESKISLAEKLGPMPGWPLSIKQTPTEITTISQMRDIPDTRPTFIVNDEIHYSISTMSHAALIRTNIQLKEYVLLKAMCVCNPTIQDLSDHAQIILTQERQKYSEILFDHCMKTQNNRPCRFVELLGIFPILERQQQAAKNFFIFHVAPILAKYDKVAEFFHEIMLSE
ncbi:unnamed protein product [Caenorhabditis brenneri]